jgi:hypothetical protein
MVDLPTVVVAAAILWFLACVIWFVMVVRGWLARRKTAAPGDFPAALLNGIFLLGLSPIVSMLQYTTTGHRYFWAGSGVLLSGLTLIALRRIIGRRRSELASGSRRSFREKSIVTQIVMILAVYGYFGVRLWGFWDQPSTSSAVAATVIAIGALIGITICMIIIGVASHIALALYARPETPDERDRVIGLRGSRNACGVLAVGVWCVLFLAITHASYGLLFYAIMGIFVLAELVRLGSQLFYYRFAA